MFQTPPAFIYKKVQDIGSNFLKSQCDIDELVEKMRVYYPSQTLCGMLSSLGFQIYLTFYSRSEPI